VWRLRVVIGPSNATPHVDALIGALAETQHGVVSASQLRHLGVGREAVKHRVRCGRLRVVHRGVYRIGRPSLRGMWLASVMASGQGAVLSHESAAGLWGLRPARPGRTTVTVPANGGRGRAGIRLHRTRNLDPDEVTRHHGIPVTTPERTIVDLAAHLSRRELERAIDEADRLRLCDPGGLLAAAVRHRGRLGVAMLREVLTRHDVGSTLTASELEERFLALCRRQRIPDPHVNAPVGRFTVDFLWPAARLIVETDGWASHRTRRAYEADRERDAELAVLGYLVVRFTYRQVVAEPLVVAARVQSLLGARAA
jgi:very-short-patch-repair endonuclease